MELEEIAREAARKVSYYAGGMEARKFEVTEAIILSAFSRVTENAGKAVGVALVICEQLGVDCLRTPVEETPRLVAEKLKALTENAEKELERERMCHAACGVIALSNTRESLAKNRKMLPEYLSASVQDCIRMAEREIKLRERAENAEKEKAELREALAKIYRFADDSLARYGSTWAIFVRAEAEKGTFRETRAGCKRRERLDTLRILPAMRRSRHYSRTSPEW